MSLPADFERVLLVKPEVSVYKIGPRPNNKGYRAADWNLGTPDWTGRMRIVSKGDRCIIRLEDKVTGQLFGECPIDEWPSIAVEAVNDSCRYFVIRLSDVSGRYAFIGIGFTDRGDSFDFNVAISDHFKWLKQSQEIEQEEANPGPKMDLSLKAGQTITINLKSKTPAAGGGERKDNPRPRPAASSFTGILPPPPGAKITGKQDLGPLFRAGGTPMPANVPAPSPINQHQSGGARTGNLIDDDWGAFSSSEGGSSNTANNNSADWVSFS